MHCLLIIIKFFAMIICIEQYKTMKLLMAHFPLHPRVTCSLLYSNITRGAPFSKPPQVSQPIPVTALRFVLSRIQLFALRPTVLLLLIPCAMAVPHIRPRPLPAMSFPVHY